MNFVTHWNEKALGSHIHLSVKSAGLLLPFVNIAMIDTVCKDFFDILLWILGLYTQEWDYWVDSSSIVNYLRHLHTVSLETVPFYVSIHSMQRFQLLHIFANSDYFVCLFVWERPSLWVWENVSLWFWFAFIRWLVILSIFSCVYCVRLLWKNGLFQRPIFNWAVFVVAPVKL